MVKYNISGDEIIIPTEVENERYLMFSTAALVERVNHDFDSWYAKQYDCNSLINNIDEIWGCACGPLLKKGVEILNAQGVYSLDEYMFAEKYIKGCVDGFFQVAADIEDRVAEIDGQKQQERLYRQQRKAGRGRVVGGGFGVGGAIKGMAAAGVMNATTGMMHSLGNAVGNMGSSIAASSSKSAVFKSAREPLKKALIESVQMVVDGIRNALEKEAGIKCKYVTVSEYNAANAILTNYSENRIPEEQKKVQLIKALQLNPYNLEAYYLIWEKCGDKNGELKKMSAYFGVTLEEHLKTIAKEYSENIYKEACGEYEKAWDKKKAAVLSEAKIKNALDDMIQYCRKCEAAEEEIAAVDNCKKILQTIDLDIRTVRGITYDTREAAESIRKDYEKFYRALAGRDIFNDEIYENIKAIDFHTIEFIENLPQLIENERKLRIPEKVYENFYTVMKEKASEKYCSKWVDISGHMGSLSEKEKMIYTITGMPMEEVVLILFDKSSNGKAGVLITNYSFRIYSKGIFSNDNKRYPIENVEKIQCLADDEYILSIRGQEPVTFHLNHKNLAAEEQIGIADAMNSLVNLVNNLRPEERKVLYRTLKGAVRCVCGMNLLPGEKICPSCKRMLIDKGIFVETEVCPNCKKLIPTGKKFCFLCGFSLIGREKEDDIFCPTCGGQVRAGKKFCTQCGSQI